MARIPYNGAGDPVEAVHRVLARLAPRPLGVRARLVLLSLAILVVVSFGFTLLILRLAQGWIEEDLQARAVTFAREIAATIGDRREFESGALLQHQVESIVRVRQNVLQLDILAFGPAGTQVVATSSPGSRLPFTRADAGRVLQGGVLSRLVTGASGRYWEVMAPVVLDGEAVGAVAAKFSLEPGERLVRRIALWTVGLTVLSVAVMGTLMSLTVSGVVMRPLRRFLEGIARIQRGERGVAIAATSADEFGRLAAHFNDMVARLERFHEELSARVREATAELDGRYREVQRLNDLLYGMQRSLAQAERLAVAGRLMAEVAHEVGTPLHSVAGHLELLRQDLRRTGGSPEAERRLDIVEGQVRRLTGSIARFLDMARGTQAAPAALDVTQLLREVADLVAPGMAAAGLGLKLAPDPSLPAVRGRGSELAQVLLNLLTNAMDATPPGGQVEIGARLTPDRTAVEVEVRDSGHGIPPDHLKQIFEPFFSTKGSRGTGLGLAIAAKIVRDHGGRIEVDSAEGAGSCFRITLPVGAVPGAGATP